MRRIHKIVTLLLLIGIMAWTAPAIAQGRSGTVLSLVVSGGSQHGDTITISSQVRADSRIQRSNLSYQVFAPDGVTIVASHSTSAPRRMSAGDTFNHSWTTNNSGFPSQGTYNVRLCWSTGNAKNCDIATATTNFYSVPTLGWTLSLAAAAILAYWLYSRRLEFVKAV
jgi:hypothetical protein